MRISGSLAFLMLLGFNAHADVFLESSSTGCVQREALAVTLYVDGRPYFLWPACRTPFVGTVSTGLGDQCSVKSAMCSRERWATLNVDCGASGADTLRFACF